jgi:hypothetical protein
MKKKLLFTSVLFSFMLLVSFLSSFSYIQPVEAFTYLDIYGVSTDTDNTLHPTLTQYYHSSGKFIFADGGASNVTMTVWVIGTSNTLEATISIDTSVTDDLGIEFIAIAEVNSTHIMIFVAKSQSGASQQDVSTRFVMVNINTYTYSQSNNVETNSAGCANVEVVGTRIFKYGSEYIVALIAGDFTCGVIYSNIMLAYTENDLVHTIDDEGKTITAGGYSWIYGVQDTEFNGQFLYIAFGSTPYDYVRYSKWDLSTGTYTAHANQPTATNRMPDPTSGDLMLNFQIVGSGIVDEFESGGANNYTWTYFSHSWSYVAGGVQQVMLVHTRLEYNETDEDLAVGNLLAIDEHVSLISTNIPTNDVGVAGGWFSTYNSFYFIYADYQASVLTTRVEIWSISDYFDTASSVMSMDSYQYDPNYAPYGLVQETIGRNFSYPYQVNLYKSIGRARIYYGLTIFEATYDVTLTWTPTDDPLYTDTWYSFTGTTFRNGIGTQLSILYFDGDIMIGSTVTDVNGVFLFSGNTDAGVHSYIFRVYSSSVSVYNETINLLWVARLGDDAEDLTSNQVIVQTVNMLIVGMVPLIFSVAPAIILGEKRGMIGFIVGGALGLGICAVTGILPSYFLAIDILLLAVIFVYMLRSE